MYACYPLSKPLLDTTTDWNPHAAPFAGASPFALPFSRQHFPYASIALRGNPMPPSLLNGQQRSASISPTSPQHSISHWQERYTGPTLIPANSSFDWPEARVSETASASPAPSFHFDQKSSTGATSVSQAPDLTSSQSEDSWTPPMPPLAHHSQTIGSPLPQAQDSPRRGSAPIRDGGLESLVQKDHGAVPRCPLPDSSPLFDPRHMLWWSQWEIVFARTHMNLHDADICLLFRYRWREKDPTTRYMREHHVAEIMAMLDEVHSLHDYKLHAHAFKYKNAPPEEVNRVRDEFSANLMVAKMLKASHWMPQ